jgi:hypothetical protein
MPAERVDAPRRARFRADAHMSGLHAQAFEIQALRQQLVASDDGPHAALLLTRLYRASR